MEHRIKTSYNESSYLTTVFGVIEDLLKYWVLARDTYKSERLVGAAIFMFGFFAFQSSGQISSVAFLPDYLIPFDDAIGFALIVIGLMQVLGVWINNRTLRIASAFLVISLSSGLEVGFLFNGMYPGMYILPIYIVEMAVAVFRNCWIKNNGAISDADKQYPAFHIKRVSFGHRSITGTVGESAFSTIIEETRRRFFSSQSST